MHLCSMAGSNGNTFEVDTDKIRWSTTYFDADHITDLAIRMLLFGYEQFKRATIITEFDALLDAFKRKSQGTDFTEQDVALLQRLVDDQLVDDVRMCAFIENQMKGSLMKNGYIIHGFNAPDKTSPLHALNKEQRKAPIPIDRIRTLGIKDSDFKKTTIGLETVVSDAYANVINIPTNIREIARRIAQRRNTLHMILRPSLNWAQVTIKDVGELNEYVDTWKELMDAMSVKKQFTLNVRSKVMTK